MAAAVSITKENVKWVSGPRKRGTIGEAITQGQLLTGKGSSSDKFMLADADSATKPTAFSLSEGAGDGQGIDVILPGGVINIGGTLAVGTAYYAHTTAGGIGLETDLGNGDYAHFVGFGKTTANLEITFVSASTVKPS